LIDSVTEYRLSVNIETYATDHLNRRLVTLSVIVELCFVSASYSRLGLTTICIAFYKSIYFLIYLGKSDVYHIKNKYKRCTKTRNL